MDARTVELVIRAAGRHLRAGMRGPADEGEGAAWRLDDGVPPVVHQLLALGRRAGAGAAVSSIGAGSAVNTVGPTSGAVQQQQQQQIPLAQRHCKAVCVHTVLQLLDEWMQRHAIDVSEEEGEDDAVERERTGVVLGTVLLHTTFAMYARILYPFRIEY